MTLFIATMEPYHDNSELIGAYSTLARAKAACIAHHARCQVGRERHAEQLDWEPASGEGVALWWGYRTLRADGTRDYNDDYLITEVDMDAGA